MLEDRYSKQPIQPDVSSKYVTLQCWWYLNAAYPIVEMALKLLTGSQERTHNISQLYRQFANQDPIRAGLVEKSRMGIRNLLGCRSEEVSGIRIRQRLFRGNRRRRTIHTMALLAD